MFDRRTRDCRLLDQDRHTLAGRPVFTEADGVDYLEVNCKNVDVSDFLKQQGEKLFI